MLYRLGMEIQALLRFAREIDKLKGIRRQTLNYHEPRRENSAEHSWHLAMAVLAFSGVANDKVIDPLKAVKMALVHDVVEIDAGDQIVYKEDPHKLERERAAADRIFGLLPNEIGSEFRAVWEEFEAGISAEAKFVRALDRFLPLMSNYLNEGHTWREHGISHAQVLERNKNTISNGSERLWKVTAEMLDECKANGVFGVSE